VTGAAGAVHIYYADRRSLPEDVVESLVTAEDRVRVTSEMHPRRRSEYLAGRALLRQALAYHAGKDSASIRISVTADGKPECVDGPAISVSHSGDLVCCAVAERGRIGIDVETGRRRTAAAEIAERFFTPAEAKWLAADPSRRLRMLWVLKEAYLKALGVGLAGGVATLDCRVEPPAITACVTRDGDAPRLTLWAGNECHLAVATVDAPASGFFVARWAPVGGDDEFGPFVSVATTE
jgi:4'-phosphopantetheinyl transferase